MAPRPVNRGGALAGFEPAVHEWFARSFAEPTRPQVLGWPVISRGESALILAPTGSGKTLTAFLWCINRLMFEPLPERKRRCRVLYVSPLKALAVDIERNLRAPLAGIANIAQDRGDVYVEPAVAVRTGDTPARERARFQREPSDILITTPESLYLLLTSNARDVLRSVDTVIIDEIHALVPTKRGAHLALSLERLQAIAERPLQRIGLSATQRPLDEVARFLGGTGHPQTLPTTVALESRPARPSTKASGRRRAAARPPKPSAAASTGAGPGDAGLPVAGTGDITAALHDEFVEHVEMVSWRDVTILDAGEPKRLDLTLDVPVEDMAALGQQVEIPSGPASQGPQRPSIWTAIHPKLLELVLQHRSTLIFVNSRRIAERLAAALNELAETTLVRAHHGSLARAQRLEIEDALKAGMLRGLVATSSLELGIDMGAIDLVVQIEAPPSVASGLQRIGRAGHQVGATSRGIIIPKYRGDLVACAAATKAMKEARVEATRFPRNPLDVLAQQIVAMVAMDAWQEDDLFATIRGAAPFAELSRALFDGVLDMLSGRYPSDEFAELRPRLTWDRLARRITARESSKRVAIVNGGTIPDRGLYGVFLVGAERGSARVGELDEEMVFESRVGETFLLGASSWRIEDITHDRVMVSPAPGEPGKMPFWKGEAAGRPIEFGREIGAFVRTIAALPRAAAEERLSSAHDLDPAAADNLLAYLAEQRQATGGLPDDRTIIVERCRDELGDWRVCVLSPLGGRVLAPWSMAAVARIREETGLETETMWTDDGFVVRFPETDEPPDVTLVLPPADEVERLVIGQLGASALFAAKFRECAARALLLPRRRPGQRTPLWQQRKRASDLLAVAARFGSFPMLLETYRECLRDLFDMPALTATLGAIGTRQLKVITVESETPSPFAASLLFGYIANYIYDGDAPLAERRAQALSIDQAQLRELLGDATLRELLDADAIDELERQLQHLDPAFKVKSPDGLHDLLLRLGDLSREEITRRADGSSASWLDTLLAARRAVLIPVAGEERVIAVEDGARYRDGLGVPLPVGLPATLLMPVRDAKGDLAMRYARTHGPFTASDLAGRFGLGRAAAETLLRRLTSAGRLVEGDFRPGGRHREWCDTNVLSVIRRRSLARLRHEIEPVEAPVLGRLVTTWQGVTRPRAGLDSLLDAIEHLQGAPLAASILERNILPARVEGYSPADLDALVAAGEVVWVGVEPSGDRDGRIALYLTDHVSRLWRRPPDTSAPGEREQAILDALASAGASFFAPLHEAAGGGFPADTVDALWNLVWSGYVTNDSMHALRAYLRPAGRGRRERTQSRPFRSRRAAPPAAEGRWSLVGARAGTAPSDTEWSAALAHQLLARYGIVSREIAHAESIAGGFSAVYDVLRTLEERGRIRRGYFASGVGVMQFALPGAIDLLRSLRVPPEEPEVVVLAATDPANPYGALLVWPALDTPLPAGTRGPTRTVGAQVVIVDGAPAAWVGRNGRPVLTWLPADDPDRTRVGRATAGALAALARRGDHRAGGLLVDEINGQPASAHPLAGFFREAGFVPTTTGFRVPRDHPPRTPQAPAVFRPVRRVPRSSPWQPAGALDREDET